MLPILVPIVEWFIVTVPVGVTRQCRPPDSQTIFHTCKQSSTHANSPPHTLSLSLADSLGLFTCLMTCVSISKSNCARWACKRQGQGHACTAVALKEKGFKQSSCQSLFLKQTLIRESPIEYISLSTCNACGPFPTAHLSKRPRLWNNISINLNWRVCPCQLSLHISSSKDVKFNWQQPLLACSHTETKWVSTNEGLWPL